MRDRASKFMKPAGVPNKVSNKGNHSLPKLYTRSSTRFPLDHVLDRPLEELRQNYGMLVVLLPWLAPIFSFILIFGVYQGEPTERSDHSGLLYSSIQ